jgi:2-(1,2-epoxy-1,2-dihydrophenyl)acetyl-CoA isomerase
MRFMMENRTLQGDEAVAWGMAGETVDDDKLAARLAEYCESLCAWSPVTLRLLKRVMNASMYSADMTTQLRYEVANIHKAFASEDSKEARKAFLEKRKPEFKGR